MLEKVKALLGITGTFQDTTISAYIDEVKQFLLDGGVDESIVNSETSAGVIARGVADLWNYGSGEGKLSEYFMQRATQLYYKTAVNNAPTEPIPDDGSDTNPDGNTGGNSGGSPDPDTGNGDNGEEPEPEPQPEPYYTKEEVDELVNATYVTSENIETVTEYESDSFDFPRRV